MEQGRSYSDEGIILARRNFGEADRIISIYSKGHGRISLIAKGIRRPKSKKRGHLEIFSYVKFQATKSKALGIVTEVETIDDFGSLRKNLKKVSLAYYFMEVVGRVTHEEETHLELFNLILGYLRSLKTARELKKLRKEFIIELLPILGFWPKGRLLPNPDDVLTDVVERNLSSVRVGKRILE